MNVLETLMTAIKTALTLMDHFSAAVTVDTASLVIKGLVYKREQKRQYKSQQQQMKVQHSYRKT